MSYNQDRLVRKRHGNGRYRLQLQFIVLQWRDYVDTCLSIALVRASPPSLTERRNIKVLASQASWILPPMTLLVRSLRSPTRTLGCGRVKMQNMGSCYASTPRAQPRSGGQVAVKRGP